MWFIKKPCEQHYYLPVHVVFKATSSGNNMNDYNYMNKLSFYLRYINT